MTCGSCILKCEVMVTALLTSTNVGDCSYQWRDWVWDQLAERTFKAHFVYIFCFFLLSALLFLKGCDSQKLTSAIVKRTIRKVAAQKNICGCTCCAHTHTHTDIYLCIYVCILQSNTGTDAKMAKSRKNAKSWLKWMPTDERSLRGSDIIASNMAKSKQQQAEFYAVGSRRSALCVIWCEWSLPYWTNGWMAGWLAGWLAAWMVDWMVDWMAS